MNSASSLSIVCGTAKSPLLAKSSPGPSRCFPFWQELLACYVVNTDSGDMSGGRQCLPALEDYYECLHHRKEVSTLYFSCSVLLGPAVHMLIKNSVIRQRGLGHYSRHTERRWQQIRESMRPRRGRSEIWGCWTEKKIRRKC